MNKEREYKFHANIPRENYCSIINVDIFVLFYSNPLKTPHLRKNEKKKKKKKKKKKE